MRQSVCFRLLAFVVALLGGLSAPATALTHGLVHAHLAEHARADEHHGLPTAAIESHPAEDHAHGHSSLDAVPGSRINGRLDLTTAGPAILPVPVMTVVADVVVHAPALADHALLARPDPGDGPPPRLRAPPLG